MNDLELRRACDEIHRLYIRSLKARAPWLSALLMVGINAMADHLGKRGYTLHITAGGISWTKSADAQPLTIAGATR